MVESNRLSSLPQEPERPAHRARKQSRLRRSVRVILHRRGISFRRRRRQEKISIPLAVAMVLAFVALVITWDWFRDPELLWLNMGKCRLAFVVAAGLALVVGVLFAVNIYDFLGAREREAQREAEKREREGGGGR